MDSTINRHNLCVTSQHEDEGYLSPSEEDLLRFNFQRLRTGYLDCNKSCDGGNEPRVKRGHQIESEVAEEETPWEVIAVQPDIRHEHLSWDKLKLPVPYRFFDEHKLCLRQIRQSPSVSYVTDNGKRDSEVVENIWRSGYLLKQLPQPPQGVTEGEHLSSLTSSSIAQDSELRKDNFFHILVAQFVQHVFHLVCGRESLSYSREKECRFSFRKNPDLLVTGLSPGTIDNFSKTYLNAGRIFRRLSHFAVLHYDDHLLHREGLQRNAVFISFLKFISDYLKLYETSLMLMESKIHSLGRLNVFFQPFLQQLDTLERVLDLYVASDQITFLKGLNSMMLCCETPNVSDLLRGAFITCASAYFRYVSDWIFKGVLTEGFHIQTARSYNYTDRRYWVKQFSQVASVPAFLENVANVIYETGRAVNLLNLIRNTESSNCVLSVVLDECYSIHPKVDFEDVAALENEWTIKVESFYEEFSFLKTDIDAVLQHGQKSQSPNHSIDFDAIEAAKQNYERTRLDTRQQALDRKAEKQKQLYDSLNAQLAEKKSREKKMLEDEKLEDEKIADYIATVDQRDLLEEMRLMKKHFGERVVDTVGVRNVKRRIADTMDSEFILRPADDTSLESLVNDCDETQPNDGGLPQEMGDQPEAVEPLEESVQLVLERSRKTSKIVTFDEIVRVETPSGTEVSVEALDDKDGVALRVEVENNAVPLSSSGDYDNGRNMQDVKEKFDPENVKIRPTVPFNTNLDLDLDISDSILIPKPMAKSSPGQVPISEQSKNSDHDSYHLSNFLSQSVAIPARAQNRMVNAALLHYFIVEKRLFQNLEALNDYLCLQNGLFGHFLTTFFVKEVNKGNLVAKEDIPRKTGRLNEILGEALALSADGFGKSEFRDKLGLIMSRENGRNSIDFDGQKSLKSKMLTSKYEVLDDIVLNFSVDWPLSILLTEDLLINYEKLFAFQMRLYRTEVLLLDIGTLLKFKGKNSRQFAILNHHRYLMLQFVRAIRHYINVTVIHCAWTDLESTFYKLNSLDRLYEGLVRHIKFVTTNCLLGAKGEGVKKLLLDQLMVIECFCTDVENYCSGVDWNNGDVIETRRFTKLDQKFKVWEEIQKVFIKVVYKLANKGTYQKVSYFLQLFNFNGYFGNDLVVE